MRPLTQMACSRGLPFMPEMLEHCGKRLRVKRRAEKTCVEYPGGQYKIREFLNNDVLILDVPRCPGSGHDGCGRSCVLFWKTAWLKKCTSSQPDTAFASCRPHAGNVAIKAEDEIGARALCLSVHATGRSLSLPSAQPSCDEVFLRCVLGKPRSL